MPDMNKEGEKLRAEGLRLFEAASLDEAAEAFGLAAKIFDADGKLGDTAEVYNNMGVIFRLQKRFSEAGTMLEKALQLFAGLGDKTREAETLGNLAPLYKQQGDTRRALEAYKQAAVLFREQSDADKEGQILMAMGILEFGRGHRRDGLSLYEVGIRLIQYPSGDQKRIRMMLQLRQKLLGG